jgi:hypothetical protein
MYIDLVSRLLEDSAFYEAACAATREFVAAQPGEREYIAAVHDALTTVVQRVRARSTLQSHERVLAEKIARIQQLSEPETQRIGMDRVAEEIEEILHDPLFASWPLEQQLPFISRVKDIHAGHWHTSGLALIPLIESVFHRALAQPEVTLDALCLLYDFLYHLYFINGTSYHAMRAAADRVMRPFAAAIRDGSPSGLPAIAPRPLGGEPLRLGYLAFFPGWTVGPAAQVVLAGLARHFPENYRSTLYVWAEPDDYSLSAVADTNIVVRRFVTGLTSERIRALAEAITADGIDILITDFNLALPTVLFERRVAPIQILYQVAIPCWPLANIDAAFRTDFYDPRLDGFDPESCLETGEGRWDHPEYAPAPDTTTIAAERSRFPEARSLIGTYVRFIKITGEFLAILADLLTRHPQLVIVLGGLGDARHIRDFIAARGLAGRLVLADEWVDGHIWGYMLDVFLDTFPLEGGLAAIEVMAKGKPVVAMRSAHTEHERLPMLIADDAGGYVELVSRLIEDREFYAAACAATRAFVAAQPGEAEYAAAIHHALTSIVRRVRSENLGMCGDPFPLRAVANPAVVVAP